MDVLRKISIEGFKCFKTKVDIDFAPITLFIGPNNSGKSSVLQSLLLLKQTVDYKNDEPALQIGGPLFDFGTYKDMVCENNLKRNIKFNISVDVVHDKNSNFESNHEWQLEFACRKNGRIVFVRKFKNVCDGQNIVTALSNRKGDLAQVDVKLPCNKKFNLNLDSSFKRIKTSRDISSLFNTYNFLISPKSPFQIIKMFNLKSNKELSEYFDYLYFVYRAIPLIRFFRKMSYIGPLRPYPLRVYTYTGSESDSVGGQGENAHAVFVKHMLDKSDYSRTFKNTMRQWFQKAGLARDFKINELMHRYYEIKVKGMKSKSFQNITDVGFGNSQVFPLAVDILLRQPGSTLVYEQPEIHLHPRAQCELGELLCIAVKEKKRCIIETHSLDLIFRLRRYLAEGKLERDDLKVYYVEQVNNGASLRLLELDNDYAFKQWPKKFFDERFLETRKIIAANVNK